MDYISNYRSKLLSGDDQSDHYKSSASLDSSVNKSEDYNLDVNELFGNSEVQTKGGDPAKGRRYLLFTVVMVLLLSFYVSVNTNSQAI